MLYRNETVRQDMDSIVSRCEAQLKALDGKAVLITGAGGMLAYYLACALMHANARLGADIGVAALVRDAQKAEDGFSDFLDDPLFRLLVQDACDEIAYGGRVDFVVHAASGASPARIKSDPLGIIRANVIGTTRACDLAVANPGCRVLLMSTREIYGEVRGLRMAAEGDMGVLDPLDPRSCYPESKRMAEQVCVSYRAQFDVDFAVARIAHAYGPGMALGDGRVMSDFVDDAAHGRDVGLNSDGTAIRAFCYVADAVAALLAVLAGGEPGAAYNVANESEPVTVAELARVVAAAAPGGAGVRFAGGREPGAYCEYARTALDTSRLESLGWAPEVGLEEGVRRTLLALEGEGGPR